MKKSLLLALAFAAVCGYVMAQDEEVTPVPEEETVQPTQPEEDAFDMGDDTGLDEETEEIK
jgi:hypothetical protein